MGVGGLVAAGPGIFQPAADRPDTTDALEVVPSIDEESNEQGDDEQGDDEQGDETPGSTEVAPADGASGTDELSADGDVECVGDNHGDTVSATAHAAGGDDDDTPGRGDEVREAAHSDCGKKGDDTSADNDKGNGKSADDDKGKSADAPGQTGATPGQSGETPGQSGETPGQSGAEPPGRSGETPGQSGETPGQSGETPGQSDEDKDTGKDKADG